MVPNIKYNKSNMQQSNQELYPDQTDEIDLRKLAKLLKERRWFIFGSTGFVTLLAIVYVLSLPPPSIKYIATTSFMTPSESSELSLNRFKLTSETTETIFASFLKKLSVKELQEKVFYENDYLAALNPENESIDDVKDYVSGFLGSISLVAPPQLSDGSGKTIVNLIEKPYLMSIQGSNGEIISSFLNELVVSANSETVDDLINIARQKIDIRLDEISSEHGLLLIKAKKDRQSQIHRIKEEDAQKIRELNDQIDALRYKEQQNRLNRITRLSNAAKLAGTLGIIENNLGQISKGNNEINLNIAINEGDDLPEWYLFGEKALLERVEILKNLTSDDPFIPELVTLNNQINEVQNNNLLQTLEERQDDSPFIARISELDVEKIKLQSTNLESSSINAMQVFEYARSQKIPNESQNKQIVLVALFGGFVLSIVLAMLMSLFKEEETEPTTKTSR